jgi:hypothetical protein
MAKRKQPLLYVLITKYFNPYINTPPSNPTTSTTSPHSHPSSTPLRSNIPHRSRSSTPNQPSISES